MESNTPPNINAKSPAKLVGVLGLLIIGGLLVGGIMPRLQQTKRLAEDAADLNSGVKELEVTKAHLAKSDGLLLPGNVRALEETQIYARTTGYLTKRYVDIGSRVKKGDVLAEIASPDVELQNFQASADQAKAVATVGQSQADVQNKLAGVEGSLADVAKSKAAIEQSKAALAGSKSRLSQTKAALASAVAKVAQARQTLETQKASLNQAVAQRDLAETTVKRYRTMLVEGYVAQQDADQAEATFKTSTAVVQSAKAQIGAAQAQVDSALQDVESSKAQVEAANADVRSSEENIRAAEASLQSTQASVSAAKANVGASRANVVASIAQVRSNDANTKRSKVLKNFSTIVAPFDGVITARNMDVGSLITSGDSSTPKQAIFSMAEVDTLRIQVAVPQTYFQNVAPGTKTTVLIRELPGKKFQGTVFQNAGAIDPSTRTLLTEVRLTNEKNLIIPGMYAQVQFAVGGTSKALRIPSNTLLIDGTGTHVAVVGSDNKLKFVPIVIARDFGTELEISNGLEGNEQLVTNPTDDLKPGQSVKVIQEKGAKA